MKILAVDTTTPRGSVALAEGSEVRGEIRLQSEASHSSRLLPAIAFLLDSLGVAPREVEGYAVTTGPGSFTGLRVGISTVQGLALASGRVCLGITALDALAARIVGSSPCLVAMMDAFRDEVFAAAYDGEGRPLTEPAVESPAAFVRRLPDQLAFIGCGAERYRGEIARLRPEALFPRRSLYLAGTLARLAAPRLAEGEGMSPHALRPFYLREAHIRKSP